MNGTENGQKKSKFLHYIEENGLDFLKIEEEMDDNTDCVYTHFDKDFPLKNNNKNIDKEQEIFKVIKHCYKYGKPPIY